MLHCDGVQSRKKPADATITKQEATKAVSLHGVGDWMEVTTNVVDGG
jgi:hypothetical protein